MKIAVLYNEENTVARQLYKKISGKLGSSLITDVSKADYIVVLGGDGTLIHSASKYAELNVPFLGINTGNLGFLTAAEIDDGEKAIEKLLAGKVFISERITLDAESFRAVNEVVVKSQFRVVTLEISVSEEKFLRVVGDGVIVATQTGSTAYSLSAGGSIVDADLNSLILTPINPIGLPVPSIVLPPNERISIKVIGPDEVSLIVDGQTNKKIAVGREVSVARGKHNVKFVYFDKKHFLKSLNAKFGLASRAVG